MSDIKAIKKEYNNVWDSYTEQDKGALFAYGERYRQFISKNKTERECVRSMISVAEKSGYQDMEKCMEAGISLQPVDKSSGGTLRFTSS